MSTHAWSETIVGRSWKLVDGFRKEIVTRFFPHCEDCGAQAARVGNQTYFRPTSDVPWTAVVPECERSHDDDR